LRSYFVKGYGLFLTLVMPVGIWCAVFGDDIILVLLGPKWQAAAPIFRWLVPTTIAFGLTNPFSWLMLATGRAGRCLKIALAVTPLLIASYAIGVGFGPKGVAIGFSTGMMLSVVPVIAWAKHGTLISGKDVLTVVMRPVLSVAVGVVVALMLRAQLGSVHAFVRLLIETSALFGTYLVALLVATKQRTIYVELLKDTGLWRSRSRTVVSPQY
jgi:PST family polysaccharide transporter